MNRTASHEARSALRTAISSSERGAGTEIVFRQDVHTIRLLMVIAALTSILVLPGINQPVSDVVARSRVAHWLWTGVMISPQPSAIGDDPDAWRWPAGIPGRHGLQQPWYGVGQSLLLLPADVFATAAAKLIKPLQNERARLMLVWYLSFPVLNGLAIIAAYLMLRSLEFDRLEATHGALSLLFATTFLWHVQNIQENNQQFFLTIMAFWSVQQWSRTNQNKWLTTAGVFGGFNLLIRLTTAVDTIGVAVFALLRAKEPKTSLRSIASCFAPQLLLFLLLDRTYQWYRFGTWGNTYMGLLGAQMRALNPRLPKSFPFNGTFFTGFWGPFISPAKSVFVYDPLLILTVLVVLLAWRKLNRPCQAYIIAMFLILIGTAAAYAKYYNWDGEASWANRFTTTPVFGLVLVAVPLALQMRVTKVAIAAFVAVALTMQAASLVFPSWIELVQNGRRQERFELQAGCDRSTDYFVAGERLHNIWLWSTIDRTSPACDTHSASGSPPLSLLPLLPLRSLPKEVKIFVRIAWLLLFTLMLSLVRRVLCDDALASPGHRGR